MGFISNLLKTLVSGSDYFHRDEYGQIADGHSVTQNPDGTYNAHSGEQVAREVLSGSTPEGRKSWTVTKKKNGTYEVKAEDWKS